MKKEEERTGKRERRKLAEERERGGKIIEL